MKKNLAFDFEEHMGILRHATRVILGNTNTGEWMKISKECFDIFQKAIIGRYTVREFIDAFQDGNDKQYMGELLDKLQQLNLISQNKEEKRCVPKYVTFAITNRCNLKCKHCCVNAADISDVLSLEECKKIIEKIISLAPEQIIFTGGEPLIRQDTLFLLKYTRSLYSGHIGIMTNGTLFTEENLPNIIKIVNSIDISLDGVDEESCSEIRGKGVFSKVMETIDILHKNNFEDISLSMVVTKQNQQYVNEFFELNKRKGTKPMLRTFSPIGRGKTNKDELKAEQRTKQKNINTNIDTSNIKMCSCGALKRTIYIDYHGEIFPCPVLFDKEYSFGKVLEQEDLLHYFSDREIEKVSNYANLLELYPQNYSECQDCDVNLFCWSCLHHVDLLKKRIISRDSRCEERKKQLQKIIWEEE